MAESAEPISYPWEAEEQDTPSEPVSRRLSACEAAMWRSGQAALADATRRLLAPLRGYIEQDHPELAGTAWDVAETEDGGLEFVTPA